MNQKSLRNFIFLIVGIKIVLLFFTPTFMFSDNLRYLSIAKTVVETKNLLPKTDAPGVEETWFPPIIFWILSIFYIISPNLQTWFFLGKLFELVCFLLSFYLVYKFTIKFSFTTKERIICFGFFAFFPTSMIYTIQILQESPLMLLTLLTFWIIVKSNYSSKDYLYLFTLSGLLILTKQTAGLIIFSSIISIFLLKRSKRIKFFLISSIVAGSLLLSGWWFYRNYSEFGNFIYKENYEESLVFYQKNYPVSYRIYNGYLFIWNIAPSLTIISMFPFLDGYPIEFFRFVLGLFFIPTFFLFFITLNKFKREFSWFIPLLIVFLLFSIYTVIFVVEKVARYNLPILTFLSIILGKSFKIFKNKNLLLKYFIVSFMIFFIISIGYYFTSIKGEKEALNSLSFIVKKYPEKNIYMNEKIENNNSKRLLYIYYNKVVVPAGDVNCVLPQNIGNFYYCLYKNGIFVFKK